ncbi:general secretion pathway protein GspH [Vibrio metoecus]|uniref:General secretion pathway protein GspH n=1 Tax=Vibrio metoecus TaxID=1481663 RepID=A0A0Q0JLU8_VIBMT|nr:general secretion pathway protein GspH [Vibrio metoecus]
MPDADLAESFERSEVSKSLETIKPRCFNIIGCSTRVVLFHKRLHHR